MLNIGGSEMIVLGVLALLVFGSEGLPEMARTFARTIKAFKTATHDLQSELQKTLVLENQKREVEARRRKRTIRARQSVENAPHAGSLSAPLPDA